MAEATFALDVEIKRSPAEVTDFLANLENFASLHPLIESITKTESTNDDPGPRYYEVVDRIPFGPFSFRTEYRASIERVSDVEVHGNAWQSPGIRVRTVYRMQGSAGGTHLYESVSIEAPRILAGYVARKARDAHAETLARIKSFLEDGARQP